MNYLYLNGQFVPEEEAVISVFDQGLLYGDGIFETFRSVGAHLYQLSDHYRRLAQSAEALNYSLSFSQRELEDILLKLREMNHLTNAYYRVTVTRGKGQIGFARSLGNDLTCLIIAKEFKGFDGFFYRDGISLQVAQIRRNAPEAISPKIKSISNLNSLLGKLEARAAGVLEVIMLNNKGHVCEGAASNVFWSKGDWVFTPDGSTGILEGVTRATIMRLCEDKLNLRVIPGEYRLQDLKFSDEVFITSTSLEVMPVVNVDGFMINQGQVGPIADKLRAELHLDMKRFSAGDALG